MTWVQRTIAEKVFAVNPASGMALAMPEGVLAPESFPNIASVVEWIREGNRLPGVIQWELLSGCNFRCPFCYIVGHSPTIIFPTDHALKLADELASAGVIQVILTGGEALIHPGFEAIYSKLKKNGIFVSVYSNLARLTEDQLSLFAELPPSSMEVSLYGHDEESYFRTTGTRSFDVVLTNLEKLKERGINLLCKVTVTTLTEASLPWARQWCADRGIPFIASAGIEDGIDGVDLSDFRISAPGLRAFELEKVQETIRKGLPPTRKTDSVYSCGVGKTGGFIGYNGMLHPCSEIRHVAFSLLNQSFPNAWSRMIGETAQAEGQVITGCNPRCPAESICKMCPAVAIQDASGSLRVDPAYCKRLIILFQSASMDGAGR